MKKTPKIGENCTAFPLFGWQIAYNVRCLAAAAPRTLGRSAGRSREHSREDPARPREKRPREKPQPQEKTAEKMRAFPLLKARP